MVNPDGALMHTHGGDDGTAIFFHGDAFGLDRTRRDLRWLSALRTLAPQMAVPVHQSGEIHPRAIRGPTRGGARSWRTYWYGVESAVEGNQAAMSPLPVFVHLHHQGFFMVGRYRGVVCHGPLVWRVI